MEQDVASGTQFLRLMGDAKVTRDERGRIVIPSEYAYAFEKADTVVIGPAPDRPATNACQKVATSLPTGVTAPSPVITIRLRIVLTPWITTLVHKTPARWERCARDGDYDTPARPRPGVDRF